MLFHNSSTTIIIETQSAAATYGPLNLECSDSSANSNLSIVGAVVCTENEGSLQIINNTAGYAVIYLSDSELNVYSGRLIFANNVRSLVAFNSNITFIGWVEFVNNHPEQLSTTTDTFQEGGAITLFQSNAFFNGNCSLQHNYAENGGGLLSMESNLYVSGDIIIAHNTVMRNGGGVYFTKSI